MREHEPELAIGCRGYGALTRMHQSVTNRQLTMAEIITYTRILDYTRAHNPVYHICMV